MMNRPDPAQAPLPLAECAEISVQLPRAELSVLLPPAEIAVELAPAELTTELNAASMQHLPPSLLEREARHPKKPRSKLWLVSFSVHGLAIAAALALMPAMAHMRSEDRPDFPLVMVAPCEAVRTVETHKLVVEPPEAPASVPAAFFLPIDAPEVTLEHEMEPAEAALALSFSEPAKDVFVQSMPEPRLRIKRPIRAEPPQESKPALPLATRVSGPTQAPRLAHPLHPRYPETQRKGGQTASVKARVWIDAEGRPTRWDFLQPDVHRDFLEAAEEALREVCFSPALHNGVPTTGQILITFEFRLR